jgi:hypothetical protein
MRFLSILCTFFLFACISTRSDIDHLATARITPDFDTYSLHRVGLVPLLGRPVDVEQGEVLHSALFTELSRNTTFEMVPLSRNDLESVCVKDPYIRGRYEPQLIIDISRRFRLDGIVVASVTDYQYFTPQRLSLHVNLVAAETGASIWSSSAHLDATSERVQRAVRDFYDSNAAIDNEDGQGWEIALLSPRLFAQFAVWQIVRLL